MSPVSPTLPWSPMELFPIIYLLGVVTLVGLTGYVLVLASIALRVHIRNNRRPSSS